MQTKYIGEQNPSPDCDILYAPVNGEFPEAKCFLYQMNRIYNDEVTRPDSTFCHSRMIYFARKRIKESEELWRMAFLFNAVQFTNKWRVETITTI
jgi:hypothetical protein